MAPKGILKNNSSNLKEDHNLTWDENNLALTESQKDSTMKVTEPKTPYVRYNHETDTVENMNEIPDLNLNGHASSSSASTAPSSRSASFSLPPEEIGKVRDELNKQNHPTRIVSTGSDDFESEEDDVAQEKHQEFQKKRGKH